MQRRDTAYRADTETAPGAPALIARSADVAESAQVGTGCRVWDGARIREGAELGESCIVGCGAFIDVGVRIGPRCKIQNNALVYAPAILGAGVFVGPGAMLTNDRHPRAVNPDGSLKDAGDWEPAGVSVGDGASIGAAAVVLGGVTIGRWAMVAAGAVVTSDVPDFALVVGVPGRPVGWVGRSGRQLQPQGDLLVDPVTHDRYRLNGARVEPLP